jgi:hypothetical protein
MGLMVKFKKIIRKQCVCDVEEDIVCEVNLSRLFNELWKHFLPLVEGIDSMSMIKYGKHSHTQAIQLKNYLEGLFKTYSENSHDKE